MMQDLEHKAEAVTGFSGRTRHTWRVVLAQMNSRDAIELSFSTVLPRDVPLPKDHVMAGEILRIAALTAEVNDANKVQ